MLTAVIEAHEGRDVMTVDIRNAFIQTEMPEREEGEVRVIMKITGVLVEMMVQLDPDKYGPCVVFEKGKKVVYIQVLRAIYGMLQAALLWYSKFREDLESKGLNWTNTDPAWSLKKVRRWYTYKYYEPSTECYKLHCYGTASSGKISSRKDLSSIHTTHVSQIG